MMIIVDLVEDDKGDDKDIDIIMKIIKIMIDMIKIRILKKNDDTTTITANNDSEKKTRMVPTTTAAIMMRMIKVIIIMIKHQQ